ncbi:MAG: helix-turn-helix domain-containing protein [Corynebacterium sp.]|nr:helix-turn-helix domain-containing protein [Corynebacterium sp.]
MARDSRNSDRSRQEILAGARRVFSRLGYEKTTVSALEEEIGMSRGGIFHHYKGGKDRLFLDLVQQDARQMAERVLEHGLIQVIRDFVESPDNNAWLLTRLEVARMVASDPSFREQWDEAESYFRDAVVARLAETNNSGLPIATIQLYLEAFLDGIISRMAHGVSKEEIFPILDLMEATVRGELKRTTE